jgi:hypothetical protein
MFATETTITLPLFVDPGGEETYLLWRAPVASTIVRFTVQTNKSQNAGTANAYTLENWGTAGTAIKASGGTILTAVGGTASADRLVADTPKTVALASFTNPYIAEGEYVALHYTEPAVGWQSGELATIQVDFIPAKVADNA